MPLPISAILEFSRETELIVAIHRVYSSGLKSVVQLVQQWLSSDKKSKNLIVTRSMRVDVSADLQYPVEL